MPRAESRRSEVIDIATVIYAGPVLVRLQDGRTFATIGGRGSEHVRTSSRSERRTPPGNRRSQMRSRLHGLLIRIPEAACARHVKDFIIRINCWAA